MDHGVAGLVEKFREILASLARKQTLVSVAPDVYILVPERSAKLEAGVALGTAAEKIPLSIGALVHGNEIGGLAVLSAYLEQIDSGALTLDFKLGFFLGNLPAALAGKRFIEADLNRSFLKKNPSLAEEHRAQEILLLLQRSEFFLDLHQTKEKSEHAFFIFPYSKPAFKFASRLKRSLPVVTHWQGSFAKEGLCSDETVNHFGGTGITLELGQCGLEPAQIALGLEILVQAHHQVADKDASADVDGTSCQKIYTWSQILYQPLDEKSIILKPGWYNFKPVQKGELLAHVYGADVTNPEKAVLAESSGWMLFPKYSTTLASTSETSVLLAASPAEVCRIVKEVVPKDLPDM